MKILLPVITLLLLITSCKTEQKNNVATLLIGDWKQDSSNVVHEEFDEIFCFEDSLCSFNSGYDYPKYYVNEDSIIIMPHARSFFKKRFLILSANNDVLKLKVIDGFEKIGDTLLFTKLKARNNFMPDNVYYFTTGCYDECPAIELHIASSGKILFYGDNEYTQQGGYSGLIDRYQYKSLLNKIQLLPVDTITRKLKKYDAHASLKGICIQKGDSVYTYISETIYSEADNVNLVSNYLSQLNKKIKLKSDTSIKSQYFSLVPGIRKMYDELSAMKSAALKQEREEFLKLINDTRKQLFKIKDKKLRKQKYLELEMAELSLGK